MELRHNAQIVLVAFAVEQLRNALFQTVGDLLYLLGGLFGSQDNTDLQQKFNAALEKVKKDGTYQTIYNKWFQK